MQDDFRKTLRLKNRSVSCSRRDPSVSILAKIKLKPFSYMQGSQNFKSRSRDPFPTPVDLFFLSFTFAICHRPSVCLSSVCLSFVHPTQAIEIFGNDSTPFGTLAICWHSGKFFCGDRPSGTPASGELNTRGVAEYSDFGPIERCKTGAKIVLITNKKSHMSFRLVPNSVTLDDFERRNSPNRCVISLNSVAFGSDYVKVVEDIPIISASVM